MSFGQKATRVLTDWGAVLLPPHGALEAAHLDLVHGTVGPFRVFEGCLELRVLCMGLRFCNVVLVPQRLDIGVHVLYPLLLQHLLRHVVGLVCPSSARRIWGGG